MDVKLVYMTNDPVGACRTAAAICTNAKDPEKALRTAMLSGHDSVLEHATFSFEISGISRSALAQITRHRIASYAVMSQRYCDQRDQGCVVPSTIRSNEEADQLMNYTIAALGRVYDRLLELGIPKEDARYALPEGTTTHMLLTMNARELGHFFALRSCNKAQWEVREVSDRMLDICKKVAPELFLTTGPGCIRGHCPEKRPCGHPRNEELMFEYEPE